MDTVETLLSPVVKSIIEEDSEYFGLSNSEMSSGLDLVSVFEGGITFSCAFLSPSLFKGGATGCRLQKLSYLATRAAAFGKRKE